MSVHLQGFGVVGCGAAWSLARKGVDFTWSDTDLVAPTAWRASTGCIYPSGSERDSAGYNGWEQWVADGLLPAGLVERADYWYCTTGAPHGSKEKPTAVSGRLKRHARPSLHLNVQRFVEETRQHFAAQRRDGPSTGEQLVISHGFNQRLKRYVWGWTAYVELQTALDSTGLRPSFYFRPNLVQIAYAYPVPGTTLWYAGSSLIVQREWASREIAPSLARWQKLFLSIADGAVTFRGEPVSEAEGWRPSTGPVEHEAAEPYWTREDGALVAMPMWHSGVRWLPAATAALLGELALA